jgi:predicted nucleotidyltransferase
MTNINYIRTFQIRVATFLPYKILMVNCAGVYGSYYQNTANPNSIMDLFLEKYATNTGLDNYNKEFCFNTSIWPEGI